MTIKCDKPKMLVGSEVLDIHQLNSSQKSGLAAAFTSENHRPSFESELWSDNGSSDAAVMDNQSRMRSDAKTKQLGQSPPPN